MNIRKIALALLEQYECGQKYVNLLLSSHITDGLSREERAILTALLYTTVERKLNYDYYICAISKRSDSSIDPHTKNILRLGLCQLLDMDSVPDFAAVNETVSLARSHGERAFVNGVLRTAARIKNSLPMPDKEKNYRRYLSVKYSFPQELVKHFSALYGEAQTERLLQFYNEEKYTDITVNTQKISVDDYIQLLSDEGFCIITNDFAKASLRIAGSVNPERLPGFSDGYFFVQDRASAIAVRVLSPKQCERVIDVCAAPGGKSFAAAILMENEGEVYSFDLHESKLSLIRSGAERLGLNILDVSARDATSPDESLFNTADKVICDAPCSGLGVLGKKPDLRYKDLTSLVELPDLQLSILTQSSHYLKSSGEILYSTCTLNPDENERVVSAFLEENGDFELVPFSVGELDAPNGMLTLLPHIHLTDGFFMAKIRKK